MVDDVLLYDDSLEGNFYHTFDYLKRCEDNEITVNSEKLQFCKMEMEFAVFMADVVKPSNQILNNISIFPEPTTLKTARWLDRASCNKLLNWQHHDQLQRLCQAHGQEMGVDPDTS